MNGLPRPGSPLAAALWLPGLLYGAAVRLRNRLYDARLLPVRPLPRPAVAVGNLAVGGTGKTPITSYLAAALREAGLGVGVVSRGYGRRRGPEPLLVSDGRRILAEPADAGDEASLVARDNPAVGVAVGADRVEAAGALVRALPIDVLILDDAFQHRRAARDLDLLLVDGEEPFGNGRMLPLGPLREPVSGLKRADAVIVTRSRGRCPPALERALERHHPRVPVFHARILPRSFVGISGETVDRAALSGFAAYAFSGIARPARFEAELEACGLRLAGRRRFPDHHPYASADLRAIAAEARGCGAEILVTTEKDLMRIAAGPEGAPPVFALALGITFPAAGDLAAHVLERLGTLLRPGPESAP